MEIDSLDDLVGDYYSWPLSRHIRMYNLNNFLQNTNSDHCLIADKKEGKARIEGSDLTFYYDFRKKKAVIEYSDEIDSLQEISREDKNLANYTLGMFPHENEWQEIKTALNGGISIIAVNRGLDYLRK